MSKKLYLCANWKMYLDYNESLKLAQQLASSRLQLSAPAEVIVFPSALATRSVAQVLESTGIAVGAQNTYWLPEGGYTGEVSAAMYKDAGCRYALVGHSERRHLFHETNHEARQKLEGVLASGLTPVLCIGETQAERKEGETELVLEAQVRAFFEGLDWPSDRTLIVAYEPVWAISKGTAKNQIGDYCDPAQAEAVLDHIYSMIMSIMPNVEPVMLFGGSVRPNTVHGYLEQPHIDGVLVGAASTKFDSWSGILENI